MINKISLNTTQAIREYLHKYGRDSEEKRILSDMAQLESQIQRTTFFMIIE